VRTLGGTLLASSHGRSRPRARSCHADRLHAMTSASLSAWHVGERDSVPKTFRVTTDPPAARLGASTGVVSNSPEFQHAFSCKAGQPMVTRQACKSL